MASTAKEEYNTNIPDKEERKRVRQARVDARNASEDKEAGSKAGRGGAQEEVRRSKGQQQIADSLAHLDKKKSGGIENITHIRVAADWREGQRRVAEEKQRQERLQRLQEEAVRSGKQNAAVEMRWAELLDQNMPQELHSEIEAQKEACGQIIASKDTLIREFQLQLKAKDEEYVKALKQQADDVEELLRRMRQVRARARSRSRALARAVCRSARAPSHTRDPRSRSRRSSRSCRRSTRSSSRRSRTRS